jgi:hypothetical protein
MRSGGTGVFTLKPKRGTWTGGRGCGRWLSVRNTQRGRGLGGASSCGEEDGADEWV